MPSNKNLIAAMKAKRDEFYTQLSDIEKELIHYKEQFKDKIVLCNCNDATSNFFKYFALNFNYFGLKKLIVTECAKENEPAYKIEITSISDVNGDGSVDFLDVEELLKTDSSMITYLEGDGTFQSDECIQLLKEADIVVTNPPFSLFRDFVSQLITYDKKFLIIGNQNAIIYKNIFPLIKEDKLWLGVSIHSGDREFSVPESYPLCASGYTIDENGTKYIRVKGIRWFTNLEVKNRHKPIVLYKTYNSCDYPNYDTYDAIEVEKTKLIPMDYDGIMGVPITFLDKYCPEQFEIIGELHHGSDNEYDYAKPIVNGKEKYARILIRKK